MDMQFLLNSFRNRLDRSSSNSYNFKQLQELEQIITPIASKISERAHRFVKILFQANSIKHLPSINWSYPINTPSQSPMCSTVLTQHSGSTFRCFNCMESNSSCICEACFKDGDHQGHNYIQYNSMNGCCDCGNAQAWNEKGFCKTHTTVNNLQIELPKSIKQQYIEEGTLLIYIYFYLCYAEQAQQAQDSIYILQTYGSYVFQYFKNLSHESYDMKLLASQLLDSRIPNIYPQVVSGELSLLEIFFAIPYQKARGYQKLIHFFFELFPVQDHRKKILTNYFKRTKNFPNNPKNIRNPLGGLNFQYLSCVKLITSMIKKGQLEPLQAFSFDNQLSAQSVLREIPRIYRKLYEDLDYINNMKSAKDYAIVHFAKTNLAEFAGYRQYSKNSKYQYFFSQMPDIQNFAIDEFFLKLFSKYLRHLKDQKEIILKGIRDLFHYIAKATQNLASLAHERAFAMLVFAYFDGDISELAKKEKKQAFLAHIFGHKNEFQQTLKHIIKQSLKTIINIQKQQQSSKSQYQNYFLQNSSQQNIPQLLDCLFYKIIILLSQGICNIDQTIFQLFIQPKQEKSQLQEIEALSESNIYKLNQMIVVLEVFNKIMRTDLDEIVIGGLVNIFNKEKIFGFYSRLVSTYKQQNAKQIKELCLQLINNQELFQEFIINYTIPEKGKLKLKQPAKPLEYYNYNTIFDNFPIKLPETDIKFLTGEEETIDIYCQMINLSAQTIHRVIDSCHEIIENLEQKIEPNSQHLLNRAVIQILKVHLTNLTIQEPRAFLNELLHESKRNFLYKNVAEQITIVSKKEEELHKDLQKIKVEQAQQFRLRRQKIMNKKKLKEQIMKKNQNDMLNKFNKEIQEINSANPDRPTCIFCKGQKKEVLSLISYVGLTNLIEKTILKQPKFHYFFTTCGHYIHFTCSLEANKKQKNNFCFLCKQETNILVPDLTSFPEEKNKKIAEQFLSDILSVLVNEHEITNGKIGKFQTLIFEQNQKLLVQSFARQLVCKGLHTYAYFKKNLYYLYLQIYQIIQLIDKEDLAQLLYQLMKESLEENNHKIQFLQYYIQREILGLAQTEDYPFSALTSEQIQQANALIKVIKTKNPQIELKQLKILNMDTILIKIPATLKQLHQYMGKCKLCPNVTNSILLCLACGWSGCVKCKQQILTHVTQQHLEGCAFIGCSSGGLKYLKTGNIFQDSSIYENYMGMTFTESNNFSELGRSQKYNLNVWKEREVKRMMMCYEVHQKIKLDPGYY